MRILGFSKKWDKLNNIEFTTFRFPRKDKDWQAGEVVQIIVQPRRKGGGDKLGNARILEKECKLLQSVTEEEAMKDGFEEWIDMVNWMEDIYEFERLWREPMNKLTLRWVR